MHKRGSPTTVSRLLLAGVANTVDLIAIGFARAVGDVKFTVIVFAGIETRAAETTEENRFAEID